MTPAIIQAMTSDVTGKVVLTCLTITHSSFGTLRIVNDTQDLVRNGETFQAYPFSARLPHESADTDRAMDISLANASLEVLRLVRGAAGSDDPPSAVVEIVDYDAPDTALIEFGGFEVQAAPYNNDTVTLSLSADNFLAEPFPQGSFTPADFPGAF